MNVSIVVLHYGRHELTDACLDSLDVDAEVVLVDNDAGYLHDRADILVRPRKNTGYAKGCNLGAAVSSGHLLVFLNNDTVPQPGWLDALVEQFDHERVSVAGARLLYPDGRVQHAGVDIFRDQNGVLTGAHANVGLALERREVAAVTGACLAIRRRSFDMAGGFHEGYWNGYEDVDLCLQVSEQGGTIVYEPDAVVLHHESASGPERWTRVRENVQLLQERWRHVCREGVAGDDQ